MVKKAFHKAANRQSDIYGIGRELRRYHPESWHKVSDSWGEQLQHVQLDVKVDANVRRNGLVVDPTINKTE
jgi:spore germination protein KC